MKPIAYYITAHGYGHGTRSCDILRALNKLAPEQPVVITTDLPLDFLDSRLAGCRNLSFRTGAFDIGLVQKDSIQSDLPATLKKLENLYEYEEELIAEERSFFKLNKIGLVVADIPALPLDAAQRSGILNIAIGNFSWDWIYEAYRETNSRWQFFIDKFRRIYKQTDLLLRLPFAPEMPQFPNKKNIPLLATPGIARREKIMDLSSNDICAEKPWILLSFTSLELDHAALEKLRKLSVQFEFFSVQPLEWVDSCVHAIDRHQVCFADVLASCDFVISKPGFGLVSECIVNDKPLIYADRGDFAEYPYLVEGIEKYLKNVYLPSDQLYAGDIASALQQIKQARPARTSLERGGAELIAEELIRCVQSGKM